MRRTPSVDPKLALLNHRFNSVIAAALIQAALGYALFTSLATTIQQQAHDRLAVVNLTPELPPPPAAKNPTVVVEPLAARDQPVVLHDWAAASPAQRNQDFMKVQKWRDEHISPGERRLAQWRVELPQGTGPARVERLQPPNLTTHTLYWPPKWSKDPLPVIAWGNDFEGRCSNSSLPYAAFLSEIASHGYFVVAVGNDDIDYPQPEGLAFLADGRPVRTQAAALTKAVDWAISENSRSGSPYRGRLDTNKVAYMGHGCGGKQAMIASSDARATTIVLLNSAARFRPGAAGDHEVSIVHLEGERDDSDVLDAGEANFAKAQAANWTMYKAALKGMGHDEAYPGPDLRWSKAVLAWLDWQLKGDSRAEAALNSLSREGWSRIDATGFQVTQASK